MAVQVPGLFDDGELTTGRGVVAKNVKWVFTGVEAGFAKLYFAIMGVSFPDLVLVTAALHIHAECLISDAHDAASFLARIFRLSNALKTKGLRRRRQFSLTHLITIPRHFITISPFSV